MLYRDIKATHPCYDAAKIKRHDLLYEGGSAILQQAALFIPREPTESMVAYNHRLKTASYKNYMASIIDGYTAQIFSKRMTVTPAVERDDEHLEEREAQTSELPPFYEEFMEDADLKGNSLEQCLREVVSEAMTHDEAYLGIDFPRLGASPTSLRDEEEAGADRAYVFYIENESVVDWEYDEFDEPIWMVIRTEARPKGSPTAARDRRHIKFKVWERKDDTVSFKTWLLNIPAGREPADNDELTLVDEGTVSFKRIPVMRLRFDEELQVGRLIAEQCASIFRRDSSLIYAQSKSLFATLVFKLGENTIQPAADDPSGGASLRAEAKDKGAIVVSAGDDVDFVEPSGAAFQMVHDGIKDDVEELHRITHTMAQGVLANSTALGRSGLSKMQDNRAKEIVLTAFAEVVKDFVAQLMFVISEGRNERLEWHVHGMDNYSTVDRNDVLKEASMMGSLDIPSTSFKKWHMLRMLGQLGDDIPPEVMLEVKREIDEAYASGWRSMAEKKAEKELEQKDIQNERQ